MATKTKAANVTRDVSSEFQYLPLASIIIEQQIRSGIDRGTDSFKALVKSIREKGILEPLIVAFMDGRYVLICGERRYLAAQELGLEKAPVRILDGVTQKKEIIALQLTENLQREDLNPIDQARALLSFFQASHPENQFDVDGLLALLVTYNRSPNYVSEAFSFTVNETMRISAKSYPTLFRTLSLLKLNFEIQTAVQAGTLPVSQGYLFAAHLDCPDLNKVFESVIRTPVTNAVLEKMLTAYQTVKPDPGTATTLTLSKQHKSIATMQATIGKNAGRYDKDDIRKLTDEVRALLDLLQTQLVAGSDGLGA